MSAKIKSSPRSPSPHRHKPKGVNGKAFSKVYWPYIPVILIIAGLLGLCGRSGVLQSTLKQPVAKVLSYSTSVDINTLLADTNSQRTGDGLQSLSLNSQLDAAAQAKANDMAKRDYWSHNTPDGNPPWIFVTNQGYDYQKLGENLATGFASSGQTVAGWMASPPHRENLLNPNYSEVGFGFANIADYKAAGGGPMTIVVAFYGQPGNASAVTAVANNDESTNTKVQAASTSDPASLNIPSSKPSRIQLIFGSSNHESLASSLIILLIATAAALWISRHLAALRKAWRRSERFAIHHPLLDIGLLVIIGLSFLLTQSTGLIK